jgi:hypothetical protein
LLARLLSMSWWMLLLRGILAVLFGVFTYMAPGITLATLVLFFGAYALADGVFGVIQAIRGREGSESRWWRSRSGRGRGRRGWKCGWRRKRTAPAGEPGAPGVPAFGAASGVSSIPGVPAG